jgi:hypothetical protein
VLLTVARRGHAEVACAWTFKVAGDLDDALATPMRASANSTIPTVISRLRVFARVGRRGCLSTWQSERL